MEIDTKEIGNNMNRIRQEYEKGNISADEAWQMVEPYVKAYNKKAKIIANKYNVTPKLINKKHIKYVGY